MLARLPFSSDEVPGEILSPPGGRAYTHIYVGRAGTGVPQGFSRRVVAPESPPAG
ncbi:hypothetical protein GCM10018954_060150 [Kutzneria kofuensis]